MLTIDQLSTRYRVAGTQARRTAVAVRLDRLARSTLTEALDAVAQTHAGEDGPHIVIRKLDLALWLDPTGTPDAAIARLWAGALSDALARALAEAPRDRVARYESRAAYLADWLVDHAHGTGRNDWRYGEFAVLDDQDTGRAMTTVLGREAQRIGPVLGLLHQDQRLTGLLKRLTSGAVAQLWQIWIGMPPAPGMPLTPILDRATGCRPAHILSDPADPDDRARHSLAWLVALTLPPARLAPEVAAPLAMQITFTTALAFACPDLAPLLEAALVSDVQDRLATVPANLRPAADWLLETHRTAPVERIATLLQLATAPRPGPRSAPIPRPTLLRSAFAGTGLLLPALHELDLADRLRSQGRTRLLCAAVPRSLRPLAEADPGLRWLAGREADGAGPVPVDWPGDQDFPAPLRPLAEDLATHGDGPEMPALRAVLDRFATGLRGMPGASANYLARQFLMQPGEIDIRPREVVLRLGPLPLRLLLVMGGRTGPQGPIPWLGNRTLIVEVPHA
jgi:hypothetical protein